MMENKEEIEKQLESAYEYFNRLQKEDPLGSWSWRRQRGYIDALCRQCGNSATIEIVDDYTLRFRCSKHGLVGGRIRAQKLDFFERIWIKIRNYTQRRQSRDE